MARYQITGDDGLIAEGDDAAEMNRRLTEGVLKGRDVILCMAHDAGARTFTLREAGTDDDLRTIVLDDDFRADSTAVSAQADLAVAMQPDLRLDGPYTDFDEWCDETGLDPSFHGCEDTPGTGDIFDAACRLALRVNAGLTAIADTEGGEYSGFVASVPGRDQRQTFFGEGVSEDLNDLCRWASCNDLEVVIGRNAVETAIEVGMTVEWGPERGPFFASKSPEGPEI